MCRTINDPSPKIARDIVVAIERLAACARRRELHAALFLLLPKVRLLDLPRREILVPDYRMWVFGGSAGHDRSLKCGVHVHTAPLGALIWSFHDVSGRATSFPTLGYPRVSSLRHCSEECAGPL